MLCRPIAIFLVAITCAAPARADDIAYEVKVLGVDDQGLRGDIDAASRLVTLKDRPPPGAIALNRRAADDRERLIEVLRSQGYYDGTVAISVDDHSRPAQVAVTITQGQRYSLAAWTVEPDQGIGAEQVGLHLGQPAVAADVVKAESAITTLLAARAHPLARVGARKAVVDFQAKTMTVTEQVDPGPAAAMAAPTVTGLAELDQDWVLARVPWQVGDPFDPAKLETLRKSLSSSGLFRSIRVTPGTALDPQGLLPIVIELTERPKHSVGGGGLYSTNEGPGVQAYWEDRDLFGHAEKLRISGELSRLRGLALAEYRAPDYFGRDRDLVSDLSFVSLNSETIDARDSSVSSGVEWRMTPIWTLSAAGALEHDIDQEAGEERQTYNLASIPLQARRDTTNDPLDPTSGGKTTLQLRPYTGITGEIREFTKAEVQQTGHFQVLDDPRVILALWGDVGSYLDSKAIDLPASKRYFAGGGGSVRGYKLYYAGPLNSQGTPAGGRSLLGFGTEFRVKITETVGVVAFYEGADVYATPFPSIHQHLFTGTGLGLRYYTPIGPIRADLAVPLERRQGVDSAYQIYVSLGQAF